VFGDTDRPSGVACIATADGWKVGTCGEGLEICRGYPAFGGGGGFVAVVRSHDLVDLVQVEPIEGYDVLAKEIQYLTDGRTSLSGLDEVRRGGSAADPVVLR
jgi:hypothetical protein